jgi:uncharacterized OsmC-like protein
VSEQTERSVEITRVGKGRYQARNPKGATLTFGTEQEDVFSSIELLLAAIAGCSAADVDYITGRRAEPERFDVRIAGDKVRDENGNHMANLTLTFDIAFPEDAAGDEARAVLPRSVQQSHDRLCTVSRTVELPTPIEVRIAGPDGAGTNGE